MTVTPGTGGRRPCPDCDSTRDHRSSPSRSAAVWRHDVGKKFGDISLGQAERTLHQIGIRGIVDVRPRQSCRLVHRRPIEMVPRSCCSSDSCIDLC